MNKEGGLLLDRVNVLDMGSNRSTLLAFPNTVGPMGNQQSRRRSPDNTVGPIDSQQPPRRVPNIEFRVLIIGRANAGKTSILQRVCDTTESPVIYRGNEEVRGPTFLSASLISLSTSINLIRQWRLVTKSTSLRLPLNMAPARRAHNRRRTCVLQSQGLRVSRFSWNRVG